VRKSGRCSTLPIPRGVSHIFVWLPKPERPSFTLDRVTQSSLGGDRSPLLPSKGRPIIWIQVLTSPTGGALLPSLVPAPHQFNCASKAFTPLPGMTSPSSGSSCPFVPGRITSLGGLGMHLVTREVTNHHLHNPGQAPKKCCRNLKPRYGTLRQFSRKKHFIVSAQTQQTRVQRLSPENKEVSPCVPLQANARFNPYIWLYVTLLAILFFQCYVTFFMF
jgi:hypothetical protein